MSSGTILSGAEIIIKALRDQGVDTIFGYPGGAVLPIYDALFKQNHIKHILVRHEQAAVHAAEGYARSSGKVGVVLVTSGPGATNAVTGLVDALMDSIPIVCLTGQVPTHLIGNDAFQECDTTGITRPATKHNYLVKDVNNLARTVHEAFYVAKSGRPGPVVIDIPKDVQFADGVYRTPGESMPKSYRPQVKPDLNKVEEAVELLANAKKPIFYVGGGVINSGPVASQLLTQLVRMTGYPCTTTLMGLGAFPAHDQQWLGMLGMHGTYEANLAMHGCDLMVCVGARFDDRVTGKVSEFSPNSKKIHIDIDPSNINKNIRVDLPIVGDAAYVLEDMIRIWKARNKRADQAALKVWWDQINFWRARECLRYEKTDRVIKPQFALERLRAAIAPREDVFISTEVGQHQMWAAQFLPFNKPNRWLTSGGLGTMGYGLPAAIGAQIANPGALCIDVAGEASIQMNIQEMSTALQYRLPVKVFILNNQWMGMVRQWQELLHGSRYSESYSEALPDFVKLADAFGGVGLRATKVSEVDDVIREMIETPRAVIVDMCVDSKENCFPMIPGGKAHNEMLLGPEDRVSEATPEEGMVLV
ncbi:acetolactate synthase 3 large subunit [Niveispirillum sp. SYP-B3756]|uniref:acetolactate synthase 3 large subunit n=1 Tax=Niveispirillum sp. SYP-B3756 TaxID=2662178 RepID=UPI00129194FA|nr:acetolactate synthase 3 large subunit [Niveispirillum sp. SYP-B3756]MQP65561.1 acetolactate synthase 3 large subunit [Niveispirillum sp. SYP-B3756]